MLSLRLVAAVLAVAFLAMTGCGSNDKAALGATTPTGGPGRGDTLDHEACDESGNRVETLDTNNDGKPDIRRVFDKAGRERCRIVDLNHDGKPDLYEYFDDSGAVRRREFCYDDTGFVNAIEHYDNGRLVKREYDTSGQGKIDTWDYFDPGLPNDSKTGRPIHPSRRERDTTGRGRPDQWWTWSGAKVTIARDTSGSGQPDPSSTITLGADENAGRPTPGPASSAPGAGAPVAAASTDGGVAGSAP